MTGNMDKWMGEEVKENKYVDIWMFINRYVF